MAAPSLALEASYTASITQLPRFGLDGSTAVKIAIQQKNSHQGVRVREREREKGEGRGEGERERERGEGERN